MLNSEKRYPPCWIGTMRIVFLIALVLLSVAACNGHGVHADAEDAGDANDGIDGCDQDAVSEETDDGDLAPTDGGIAWVRQAGGAQLAWGMNLDALSDHTALVTGIIAESVIFGRGEPHETTLTSAGLYDAFVARYQPDGSLAWARRMGGSGIDLGVRLVARPDGSSIVLGGFQGSAVFGSTTLEAAGELDLFLAEYDPHGDFNKVLHAASTNIQLRPPLVPGGAAMGLGVCQDGSFLVAGFFNQTITFAPGSPGVASLSASGARDAFLVHLDTDGTPIWQVRAGGEGETFVQDIAVQADGSCVVTGGFNQNATFGPGESGEVTIPSAGDFDIFVARYRPDGRLDWVRKAGSDASHWEWGTAVALMADGGPVVTGDFAGSAVFGAGEAAETTMTSEGDHDMFVARFSAGGELQWARQAHGVARGYDIDVTPGGETLATGKFFDEVTPGRGEPGAITFTSAGEADILVTLMEPDGDLIWACQSGGPGLDLASGLATSSDGHALLTGGFTGRTVFGQGEAREIILTAFGDWDLFLLLLRL
jgi:hypothetical protein